MSIQSALTAVDTQGLSCWAEAEYQLRRSLEAASADTLAKAHFKRSCQALVEQLYAERGLTLPPYAMCPAFDLLRHRTPYDVDLVTEARALLEQLERLYWPTQQDGAAQSATRDTQLRRLITLANLIDQSGGPQDGRHSPLSGPFSLPPGPFKAFSSEVQSLLGSAPPLLACLAVLERLETHDALFPERVRPAAILLWPVLLTWCFGHPAPLIAPRPQGRLSDMLPTVGDSANRFGRSHGDLFDWYTLALHRGKHSRTGSMLPLVLQEIASTPLFTANTLSQRLGCTVRTVENQITRLEEAGVIRCLQQSGRLRIWTVINL